MDPYLPNDHDPVEHETSLQDQTSSDHEAPKVIREFLNFAVNAKEQEKNLVGEFNSRLFDEAVDMTVHRLRTQLGEDLV